MASQSRWENGSALRLRVIFGRGLDRNDSNREVSVIMNGPNRGAAPKDLMRPAGRSETFRTSDGGAARSNMLCCLHHAPSPLTSLPLGEEKVYSPCALSAQASHPHPDPLPVGEGDRTSALPAKGVQVRSEQTREPSLTVGLMPRSLARPLLTAHCPLLTAHCSLPTAHCSPPTAHCLYPVRYKGTYLTG